jgi:hypothetical protein
MGIGAGILIAAIGAILAFAVDAELNGVDVQTIGVILLIAGIVIAVIAAAVTASRRTVVGDRVVEEPVGGRRVVRETYEDGTRI